MKKFLSSLLSTIIIISMCTVSIVSVSADVTELPADWNPKDWTYTVVGDRGLLGDDAWQPENNNYNMQYDETTGIWYLNLYGVANKGDKFYYGAQYKVVVRGWDASNPWEFSFNENGVAYGLDSNSIVDFGEEAEEAEEADVVTILFDGYKTSSRIDNPYTNPYTISITDFEYSISQNNVTITKYKGNYASVTIPSEIEGKPVTSIEALAFMYCSRLMSVEIPNSVTDIGPFAFYGCSSLTDVYYTGIQKEWKKINIGSYNGCLTNATIHYNYSDLLPDDVLLDKEILDLEVGQMYTLTATITPSNAANKTVTWTTSNSNVVTVSGGKVTAVSAGTATVTAKSNNGKTAICQVTVKDVESVDVNKHSMTLGVGQAYTLRPTTTPDDIPTTFKWKTSNKNIATVTSLGKVTGRAVGKATITVKTANGKTATCTVVVKNAPDNITLNKSEITLGVGQMYTLQSTLTPTNTATYQQWTSSDKTIVVVNDKGRVTGKKVGTATITVKTTNGHTAACKVTVKKAPTGVAINKTAVNIGVAQKHTLKAVLTPTNSATYCTWTSSDTSVATVTSGGVVTGKEVGTATIMVKTSNGKTAECTVKVKKAPDSITLDKTTLTLKVGDTYTLTKTLSPANSVASYTWLSSDTAVATVSSTGKVTAKKTGTSVIIVTTHNGKIAICTVTVK